MQSTGTCAICTNCDVDAGNEPGEARRPLWALRSKGAEKRKSYQTASGRVAEQIAQFSNVPILFLLRRCTGSSSSCIGRRLPSSAYVSDFFATSDGLALRRPTCGSKTQGSGRSMLTWFRQIAGDDKTLTRVAGFGSFDEAQFAAIFAPPDWCTD